MLLEGQDNLPPPESRSTLWRETAEQQCGDARAAILEMNRIPRQGHQRVLDRWLGSPDKSKQTRQTLASRFATFAFGQVDVSTDADGNALIQAASHPSPTVRTGPQPVLRATGCWLAELGGYGCWRARYGPSLPQEVAGAATRLKAGLTFVLAPAVTESVRQKAIEEFHHRGVRAAIIDDLDLVRLLQAATIGQSRALAALEIGLEQQPPRAVDPFAGHEGQHVKDGDVCRATRRGGAPGSYGSVFKAVFRPQAREECSPALHRGNAGSPAAVRKHLPCPLYPGRWN